MSLREHLKKLTKHPGVIGSAALISSLVAGKVAISQDTTSKENLPSQSQNVTTDYHNVSTIATIEETNQLWQKSAHIIEYQRILADLKIFQNGAGGTYQYDSETKTGTATFSMPNYTKIIKTNAQGIPIRLIENFGTSHSETQWNDNGTLKSKTSSTNSELLSSNTKELYDQSGNLEQFSSSTQYHNLNLSKKIEKKFKDGHLVSMSQLTNRNGKQSSSSYCISRKGVNTIVTEEINGIVVEKIYSGDKLINQQYYQSNNPSIEINSPTTKSTMSPAEKAKRLEKYRRTK